MKNYNRLPQDIQREFENVLVYGSVCDSVSKAFHDEAIEKFAALLLHKYRVREVHAHLDGRK